MGLRGLHYNVFTMMREQKEVSQLPLILDCRPSMAAAPWEW